ncbi:hypothetical protein [Dactylosporangium sp. NPDC049140]|uniref:hypothetical protein n=1 Tax=Dactylosporangium sp. NPDC049140 TaxID=3155647 RepID=UPI0033F1A4D5
MEVEWPRQSAPAVHRAYAARTLAVNEIGMHAGRDVAFARLLADPAYVEVQGRPSAAPRLGDVPCGSCSVTDRC